MGTAGGKELPHNSELLTSPISPYFFDQSNVIARPCNVPFKGHNNANSSTFCFISALNKNSKIINFMKTYAS
jgi:hypothetical protein